MTVTVGTYGALDSTGWSVITPKPDPAGGITLDSNNVPTADPNSQQGTSYAGTGSRLIYVDPVGGLDTNPGTYASPKQTLNGATGACNYIRGISDGVTRAADWVLLKCGTTFTKQAIAPNGSSNCAAIGFDADNPFVVTSYGTGARPIIKTDITAPGYGPGLQVSASNTMLSIAILGIDFYCSQRDPGSADYLGDATASAAGGAGFYVPGVNPGCGFYRLLIEDCVYRFFFLNIAIDNQYAPLASDNMHIRRNIIYSGWGQNNPGRSQGLDIFNGNTGKVYNNITIEENIFDANGFLSGISGTYGTQSDQARNFYGSIAAGYWTNYQFRGNISSRSSSEGVQFRGGASNILNNLFLRDSTGFDVGHGENFPITNTADTTYNVVTESENKAFGPRGFGIAVWNSSGSGVSIQQNLLCHCDSVSDSSNAEWGYCDPYALNSSAGTHGIKITNNVVFNWKKDISDQGSTDGHGAANTTSGNAVDLTGANTAAYSDPWRSVASYYAAHVAGATPNSNFNGYIASGVLHITSGFTGTLSELDAVTFFGQTTAIIVTSVVSAGVTYNVLSAGDVASVGSPVAMNGYASSQFCVAARAQLGRANGGWNASLSAANVNTYLRQGFGLSGPAGTSSAPHGSKGLRYRF